MNKLLSSTGSRYGWRWIFVLLGIASWVSIGCSPQTLSMFMMPWVDNNIPPEYPLFKVDKEITLVVVSSFARNEIHPDLMPMESELADQVAFTLRERCEKNKHRIKIVPAAQVRIEQLKQQVGSGVLLPIDLGKTLKADYVLELTINSIGIKEKNFFPEAYRGQTDITIGLYKVDGKDGETKVFSKDFQRVHPVTRPPIDASSMNPSTFRRRFVAVTANDISKMLIAYPPEEKRQIE